MKATFAAGCFWGVEEAFRRSGKVLDTCVGYIGGYALNPSYKQICSDKTGHAEACQVEYDPAMVEYSELLRIFWASHDPTQLNRQGPDRGSQYRSAIFCHDQEQEREALASKEVEQAKYSKPIVTEIKPADQFWRAEDYHQQYLAKTGRVCHI